MVNDQLLLQGFTKCKSLGALAMVHAENGDDVYAAQQKMIELRLTGLKGHPLSRCAVLEGEATSRAIRLYVVYVMSIDVMEEIVKVRKSDFSS